jgi:uncharacterized protein YuzE
MKKRLQMFLVMAIILIASLLLSGCSGKFQKVIIDYVLKDDIMVLACENGFEDSVSSTGTYQFSPEETSCNIILREGYHLVYTIRSTEGKNESLEVGQIFNGGVMAIEMEQNSDPLMIEIEKIIWPDNKNL